MLGHQRLQQQRMLQGALVSDYEEQRSVMPPPDPVLMEREYTLLRDSPRSDPETLICRFIAKDMHCQRTRRWEWWCALAHIKFYVRELYLFTQHNTVGPSLTVPNSTSSGNPGQEVVRTPLGTVTWVPSDHRIICSTSNRMLQRRLTLFFDKWVPEQDMCKRYSKGRIPAQIATLLRQTTQKSKQLFQ